MIKKLNLPALITKSFVQKITIHLQNKKQMKAAVNAWVYKIRYPSFSDGEAQAKYLKRQFAGKDSHKSSILVTRYLLLRLNTTLLMAKMPSAFAIDLLLRLWQCNGGVLAPFIRTPEALVG